MIRDRVDIDQVREALSELHSEVVEVMKLLDIVDFAENPGMVQSDLIDVSEIFSPVEIDADCEEEIVEGIQRSVGAIAMFCEQAKRSVNNG